MTDDERAALVEQIVHIVESVEVDLGGWDGWGRCPTVQRPAAVAATRAILAAIEGPIRAVLATEDK